MVPERRKILFAVSEAVPFIKTGGLADVAGSLPQSLDSSRFDCRVILPKYACIRAESLSSCGFLGSCYIDHDGRNVYVGVFTVEYDGIRYYFIDNEEFFGGVSPYEDAYHDIGKFCFFEKAVLAAIRIIGFKPELIHCHDWQTGLIPAFIRERQEDDFCRGIKTVFTIHNLKYQGRCGMEHLKWMSGLPDSYFTMEGLEFYHDGDMLKGGIVYADAVTTVSQTYAEEIKTPEYGEGLDGMLRKRAYALKGIINGIDCREYDPENDRTICSQYNSENFSQNKMRNKTALQRDLGLQPDEEKLLIGMVTRLTDQKGIDLIGKVLKALSHENIQLAVVGTGDKRYEQLFIEAAKQYPGQFAVFTGYSDKMAHMVYAGADAYLMPSAFEPCGLSQLIALRYGTVPIVRETGGLKDTVRPFDRKSGTGTGFAFSDYSPESLLSCIREAENIFAGEKNVWNRIVKEGMKADFSWKSAALKYQEIYERLID